MTRSSTSSAINVEPLLQLYDGVRYDLEIFMDGVASYLGRHPSLTKPGEEVVHSYRKRLKDRNHLAEKIGRKIQEGNHITEGNFFDRVTDLAGVRVLHLFLAQFGEIDAVVRKRISDGDWSLFEKPKVYTWDPENVKFFWTVRFGYFS